MTPILAFSGFSNSGKTTLLEKLIPALTRNGLRVAIAKHDVHGIAADETGKDSQRLKKAGAEKVMLIGPKQSMEKEALVKTNDPMSAIKQLAGAEKFDLILCEGFKSSPIPKIAVYRSASGKPALDHRQYPQIIARVGDPTSDSTVPCFGFEDIDNMASFILEFRKNQ